MKIVIDDRDCTLTNDRPMQMVEADIITKLTDMKLKDIKYPADATRLVYDSAVVFGEDVLYTDLRVDRETVPAELFVYDVRHCDDDWGDACEIAPHVQVNHMGTIVTKHPITLNDNPYGEYYCRRIDAEDEFYFGDKGPRMIFEYLKEKENACNDNEQNSDGV